MLTLVRLGWGQENPAFDSCYIAVYSRRHKEQIGLVHDCNGYQPLLRCRTHRRQTAKQCEFAAIGGKGADTSCMSSDAQGAI